MRGMLVSETAPPDVGLSGEFVERRSFTSTYSDTSDLLLTRLGITLVRRVENGGPVLEAKLPQAAKPPALQVAGGPAGPPGELRRLLDGVLGGRELSPVATLRTRRTASSSVVLDAVDVMDSRRVSETLAEFELLDGKRVSKELRRAL